MRGSAGPAVGPATGFVPRGDQQFRWPVERDPTRRFPDPARRGDCGSGRHRSHVRKRRIPETLWARVRAQASTVLTRTRRPRGVETRGGRAADPRRAGPCRGFLPPAPCPPVLGHFCCFQVGSSSTHHSHAHTGPRCMGSHTWAWSAVSSLRGPAEARGPPEGGAGARPGSRFLSLAGGPELPGVRKRRREGRRKPLFCVLFLVRKMKWLLGANKGPFETCCPLAHLRGLPPLFSPFGPQY